MKRLNLMEGTSLLFICLAITAVLAADENSEESSARVMGSIFRKKSCMKRNCACAKNGQCCSRKCVNGKCGTRESMGVVSTSNEDLECVNWGLPCQAHNATACCSGKCDSTGECEQIPDGVILPRCPLKGECISYNPKECAEANCEGLACDTDNKRCVGSTDFPNA